MTLSLLAIGMVAANFSHPGATLGLADGRQAIPFHRCDHDRRIRRLEEPEVAPETNGGSRRVMAGRSKFRIKYDLYYVDHINSQLSCATVGQEIVNIDGKTITCGSADLVTPAKRQAITDTFAGVQEYLEGLLSVDPLQATVAITPWSNAPLAPGVTSVGPNEDYLFTVIPEPFGAESGIIAAAAARTYGNSRVWGRPVAGWVWLNVPYVPEVAPTQRSLSGDRAWFNTVVHETLHALGISSNMFERWINPETGLAYGMDLPRYSFVNPDFGKKTYLVLATPRIHDLVSARFGKEFYFGNPSYPVGAELEDYGGSGTAGSHTELRQFLTDTMNGIDLGYSFLSEVTLTLLLDTGWYDVDMTQAEPLAFGNWRSIRGAKASDFSGFTDGVPALNWPEHYLSRTAADAEQARCTYDLRAYGLSARWGSHASCNTSSTDPICDFPGFYDPTNTGVYGYPPADWTLINVPGRVFCQSTRAANATSGEAFGEDSWCGMSSLRTGSAKPIGPGCFPMRCGDAGEVYVTVNGVEKQCTGATQTWEGFEGAVTCPNASVLCGMLDYVKYAPTPAPTNLPRPTPCQGIAAVSPSGELGSFEIEINEEPTTLDGWMAAVRVGSTTSALRPGTVETADGRLTFAVSARSCDTVTAVFELTNLRAGVTYGLGLYGDPYWGHGDFAASVEKQKVGVHKNGLWLGKQGFGLVAEPALTDIYAGEYHQNVLTSLWGDEWTIPADVVAVSWQGIRLGLGETGRFYVNFTLVQPSNWKGLSTIAIAGIVILAVVVVGAIIGVIVCCVLKKPAEPGSVGGASLSV